MSLWPFRTRHPSRLEIEAEETRRERGKLAVAIFELDRHRELASMVLEGAIVETLSAIDRQQGTDHEDRTS